MAASPLEQFEVAPIVPIHVGGLDISFTNSSLWMCIVVAAASLFLALGASSRTLVPSRMQSMAELSYEFVANMVRSAAGDDGMKFFPFVFTLFMFVLFSNMLGLVPYSFTVTSHIIVTAALAVFVFCMVVVVGFLRHGARFLTLFAPPVHWIMLVVLVPIEIISFLSRPVSHSIRLFANMMAGHTMLKIFGTFVVGLAGAGGILSGLSIMPMIGIVAVTALEFLIAFLQAYVFAILTCIYLNDALHMHDHH